MRRIIRNHKELGFNSMERIRLTKDFLDICAENKMYVTTGYMGEKNGDGKTRTEQDIKEWAEKFSYSPYFLGFIPWDEPAYDTEIFQHVNQQCGACAAVCPAQRLERGSRSIDRKACTACGRCVSACGAGALLLSGRRMTAEAVVERVLRDKDFYDTSGGGLTLSGGEPLLQADFCGEVARECRQRGISVLVDTAANVPYDAFRRVLPYAEQYYVDLKGATEEDYRLHTGGSLALTLENMARLVRDGAAVTARLPIIPGYNASPEYGAAMAAALAATGVGVVHLLPFHSLCAGKYEALGRAFPCRELSPPSAEEMERLEAVFRRDFEVAVQG